jgi:hypothetical protein
MDIWELVGLVVLCFAAYKAGQWSVVIPIVRGIRREIDEGRLVLEDDEDDLEEIKIRLERHDNVYYAYAVDGGFLAQGRSFVELFDSFQARYPLQSFKIQKNTDFSDAERNQMISALEDMVKRITAK